MIRVRFDLKARFFGHVGREEFLDTAPIFVKEALIEAFSKEFGGDEVFLVEDSSIRVLEEIEEEDTEF